VPWCLGGSNLKSPGALVVKNKSWCLGGSNLKSPGALVVKNKSWCLGGLKANQFLKWAPWTLCQNRYQTGETPKPKPKQNKTKRLIKNIKIRYLP
jgi:hypothetical protein